MDSLNLRIISTHDTAQRWEKLTEFVPRAGEIIIYDSDDKVPYARFKVGDGKTLLKDLPFSIDSVVMSLFDVSNDTIYADAGRVTRYKTEDSST